MLLLPLVFTGCLSLTEARVPQELVEGNSGNGWQVNDTASDDEVRSRLLGLVRFRSIHYEDLGDRGGYPASLSISTLRTPLAPSEDDLRERVREQVVQRAEANGIRFGSDPTTGTRDLAQGYGSRYFVYDGNVTQGEDSIFTRDARVRILGEVWTCQGSRTSIVAVALAQVTDVRYVGGQPILVQPDDQNWREVVADPQGSIDGIQGQLGLVYNVRC